MLTEKDIDSLMIDIQDGKDAYVYYIAHMVELREGFIDEYHFKSSPAFRVIKLKVNNIQNAYFEYINFVNNPNKYHEESEETYPDEFTKYVHYYTVPNLKSSYALDFNSRMPSAIYGTRRVIYKSGKIINQYNDPSPIKPIYINALTYGEYSAPEVQNRLSSGDLSYDDIAWKYKRLDAAIETDGVLYNYLTSDWYIFDIENFPRVEKPLINTKTKTAYFLNHVDAHSYLKQLLA